MNYIFCGMISLRIWVLARPNPDRQKSLCENSNLARFCSARLHAGALGSSRRPPEGGRYTNQTEHSHSL